MGSIYGYILKILIQLEQREYRKQQGETLSKKLNIHFGSFIMTLLAALAIGATLSIGTGIHQNSSAITLQQGIAKEIIRFHVLANSDSDTDQALKLKIKDAIIHVMAGKIPESADLNITRGILEDEMDTIIHTAEKIIKEEGYNYAVNAALTMQYFPTKMYGDMTFPPGEYEALRVEIGDAKGKNWWCVMYPPLCLIDGTYAIVPDDSKAKLKGVLTEDEYDSLITNEKIKVKIKFKLFS